MAKREDIKKALQTGGEDLTNPQHRMDAALLSIMDAQDAAAKKPAAN